MAVLFFVFPSPVVSPTSAVHTLAPPPGTMPASPHTWEGGNAIVAQHVCSPRILCARLWLVVLGHRTRPRAWWRLPPRPRRSPSPSNPRVCAPTRLTPASAMHTPPCLLC